YGIYTVDLLPRSGFGSFYGIYTVDLLPPSGFGSFYGIYTVDLLLRPMTNICIHEYYLSFYT
ncbi:hypothetical protein, partial [Paenibacillus odorifer]|uniref:hypothetical protein n=2 Tax=Paenibacillus TaxID=44249 RepID=UPI0015C383A1